DTTVTTSTKNDIVYMMDAMDDYDLRDLFRKDSITYTGGDDSYFSLAGNTTYNVKSFTKDTNLTIYDNIELLDKIGLKQPPSPEDAIKFNANKSDLTFFFDIKKSGDNMIVSDNTSLHVINNSLDTDVFYDIADSSGTVDGTVQIVSFFKEGETFGTAGMYGNGRIEKFATNDDNDYELGLRISYIKEEVADWFAANTEYTSVYEAFEAQAENIESLIACYTTVQYA
ncbi:hypothetical protein IKQ21_05350, partial [bacterium]|nr:hypothetical protein [bacterium]